MAGAKTPKSLPLRKYATVWVFPLWIFSTQRNLSRWNLKSDKMNTAVEVQL